LIRLKRIALAVLWGLCCAIAPLYAAAENNPQAGAASPPANTRDVDQLVTEALAHNADFLAAKQRLAEAQGLLRQAGLRPNPSVETVYGTGAALGDPNINQLSITYSHIFELGGKRGRRVDLGRLDVQTANAEVADRERLLKAEVRTAYAESLASLRNLTVATDLLRNTRESLQITQARVQSGESPRVEQGLLSVEVNRLESDRTLFGSAVDRNLLALKQLVGMKLEDALQLSGDLHAPLVPITLEDALKRAQAQRPDLRLAQLSEQSSDAQVSFEKAQAVPNLVGIGQYTRSRDRLDQFGLSASGSRIPILDKDQTLGVGISIDLPIRNRNQGNIEAAVARTRDTRFRRQYAEQIVEREVRAAFNRYEAARKALSIYDSNVLGQAQDNLRILRAAYTAGELRLFDVLTEQRRLIDTQRAYTDVLKEYYEALVELERAVGGPIR
jgi:cobalt-zinc-cadmium efflux system outer membrane protein